MSAQPHPLLHAGLDMRVMAAAKTWRGSGMAFHNKSTTGAELNFTKRATLQQHAKLLNR